MIWRRRYRGAHGIRGIDGSNTLLAEINAHLDVHPGMVDRAPRVGGRDRSMAEGSAWGHCPVLLHDVLGNAHDYGLLVLGTLQGPRKPTALPSLVGAKEQSDEPQGETDVILAALNQEADLRRLGRVTQVGKPVGLAESPA
jgi:hypothetical protein